MNLAIFFVTIRLISGEISAQLPSVGSNAILDPSVPKFNNDTLDPNEIISFGSETEVQSNLTVAKSDSDGIAKQAYRQTPKPGKNRPWNNNIWRENDNCFREDEHIKCEFPRRRKSDPIYCLGAKVKYPYWEFKTNNESLGMAGLEKYRALMGLPECGSKLRHLACTMRFAPCVGNRTKLLDKNLCKMARNACSFVIDNGLWPKELDDCDNDRIYTTFCQRVNPGYRLGWNASQDGGCVWPLVRVGGEGGGGGKEEGERVEDRCGLNCTSPFFSPPQHASFHHWLPVVVTIAFFAAFLTWASGIVGRNEFHRSLGPLFTCVLFYMVICICWLLPVMGLKQSIMCFPDGSLRTNEPRLAWSSCLLQFMFLYLSVMGCGVWVVVYSLGQYYCAVHGDREGGRLMRKRTATHVMFLGIPIILLICSMVLWSVDADGLTGVCFVGHSKWKNRSALVYAPLGCFTIVAWSIFLIGLFRRGRLVSDDSDSCSTCESVSEKGEDGSMTESENARFNDSFRPSKGLQVWKTVGILLAVSLSVIGSVAIHVVTDILQSPIRKQTLKDYLLCKLNETESRRETIGLCEFGAGQELESRLFFVQVLLLQFLPLFAICAVIWTSPGVKNIWTHRFRKIPFCERMSNKRHLFGRNVGVKVPVENHIELSPLQVVDPAPLSLSVPVVSEGGTSGEEDVDDSQPDETDGGDPNEEPTQEKRPSKSKHRKSEKLEAQNARLQRRAGSNSGSRCSSVGSAGEEASLDDFNVRSSSVSSRGSLPQHFSLENVEKFVEEAYYRGLCAGERKTFLDTIQMLAYGAHIQQLQLQPPGSAVPPSSSTVGNGPFVTSPDSLTNTAYRNPSQTPTKESENPKAPDSVPPAQVTPQMLHVAPQGYGISSPAYNNPSYLNTIAQSSSVVQASGQQAQSPPSVQNSQLSHNENSPPKLLRTEANGSVAASTIQNHYQMLRGESAIPAGATCLQRSPNKTDNLTPTPSNISNISTTVEDPYITNTRNGVGDSYPKGVGAGRGYGAAGVPKGAEVDSEEEDMHSSSSSMMTDEEEVAELYRQKTEQKDYSALDTSSSEGERDQLIPSDDP